MTSAGSSTTHTTSSLRRGSAQSAQGSCSVNRQAAGAEADLALERRDRVGEGPRIVGVGAQQEEREPCGALLADAG